jgi:hypothetical protein
MRLPAYAAEASVGRTRHYYRASGSTDMGSRTNVLLPSRFSWINLGFADIMGYGMPGMTLDEILADLGVGQGSCLLGCGELRADCFREGGTREECDEADRECTWDCFVGSGEIA